MTIRSLLNAAGAALHSVTASAGATTAVNTTTGAVLVGGKPAPGLTVHGYDVVSFFAGTPTQGDANFAVVENGATYRFTSQSNLEAFKENPAKYEPAYGGFCAYGVAVGAMFDGDPRYWQIVDGRLYLNLSADIQDAWNKDIPGNIAKADGNWPRLAAKLPPEIE